MRLKLTNLSKISKMMATLLLCVFMSSANATPMFLNHSFETGNTVGWVDINPFGGTQNWLLSFGLSASDGDYAYWFGATDNGGITRLGQTLSGFTIGSSYTVWFDMITEHNDDAGRTGAYSILDFVGADISSAAFEAHCQDDVNTFFNCSTGWQEKSVSFMATATDITFTWRSDISIEPSWEFGFDNVRLTSVPEPTTFVIFALGMFFLASRRLNKANIS